MKEGRSGSERRGERRAKKPRMPEERKVKEEMAILRGLRSEMRRKREAKMRMNGVEGRRSAKRKGEAARKSGRRRRESARERREEAAVVRRARKPFPSRSRRCPGRIERTVFSSGTKRKIAGMHSKARCADARATMKRARVSGGRGRFSDRTNEVMVLLCRAGVRPASAPRRMPERRAAASSNFSPEKQDAARGRGDYLQLAVVFLDFPPHGDSVALFEKLDVGFVRAQRGNVALEDYGADALAAAEGDEVVAVAGVD